MYNKFKDGDIVIVNGLGKCDNKRYKDKIGKIICRDSFFFDYNIKFEDGTEDWIDDRYIEKYESEETL